jgi:transcriptional regulator GlxA family with amidase domain
VSPDRAPSAEILRGRPSIATNLLVNTQPAIPEVAARPGFGTPRSLARVFGEHSGASPRRFRATAAER